MSNIVILMRPKIFVRMPKFVETFSDINGSEER